MDFRNFKEKFLQSVQTGRARSFILSSSSDKPEVPARAAAAAAVAKSIAGLPPHQRLSLASTPEGESPSVYSARKRGQNADPLEEEYFEQDFDPVRRLLEELPEQPNEEFFETRVSKRMLQLDSITETLAKQVMDHHEEMVKGMQLVTELEKDLQVAKIICKNGRRRLSMATHEVSQDLVVAANVKKKQVLMEILPYLEKVQHAMDIKSRLDNTIDEGDFGKALHMCSECLQLIDECSELVAVQEMSTGIEEWLQGTIIKVDAVLLDVCRRFDPKEYMTVIEAYAMIDDVAGLSDKVQTFFAQIIVGKTHEVLRIFLPQDDPVTTQKRGRLPYNDLCLRLPEAKYRACLCKTLEVLFDILCSYHAMMTWQWLPQAASNGSPSSSNGKQHHHRSRSHGSLETPPHGGAHHGHTSSFESVQALPDTSTEDGIKENSRDRLRIECTTSVGKGLEKGRKTVWELAARRVSALLSSDAICACSPHQFLNTLDLLNKFILSGEAFSGAEATPLRAKLVKQSEKYFFWFHRQNLEVLRMMLEKEPWQRLPSGVLQSVNLAGVTGNGAAVVVSRECGECMMLKPGEKIEVDFGFNEWLRKGNPFSDSSVVVKDSSSVGRKGGVAENGNVNGKDDEEEDEDLMADFIDEDSQRPSRFYNKASSAAADDDGKITITGSSLSILRYIDRYARLMRILQPISSEVFRGLCQVFELYFFVIFKVFGHRDAFGGGRGGQMDAHPTLMSSRLRGSLVRISQQLEEQRLKGNHPSSPPSHAFDLSSGGGMLSPTNLYAIKERTVATESLMYIVTTLRASRSHLQSMLQQNSLPIVDQFYSRTVDVATDLKEHLYKTAARLLLNIGGYIDRISNVKWELKDIGTEHNGYVDLLLGEFKQYTNKLSSCGISKQIQEILLAFGIDILAETLVEGISRVRRCNNEGRALMSLDLQNMINGLQHLTASKIKPNLQLVEVFIKAFYLPETEYLFWAKAHPEYSKAQIIGLINLVATMNNWKKKTRTDLIERIESGDL